MPIIPLTKISMIQSVADKLFPQVRKRLGLGRCKVCEESLRGFYSDDELPSMFATGTMFYTSEECQEDVITERLNTLIQNELKVPLGQNKTTLTVEAISTNEYNAEFRDDSKPMLPSFCNQFFDLFRFSECPSVTLNQDH